VRVSHFPGKSLKNFRGRLRATLKEFPIYFQMKDYASSLAYAEKAVAILQFNFPNGHPNLDVMTRNLENIKKVRG